VGWQNGAETQKMDVPLHELRSDSELSLSRLVVVVPIIVEPLLCLECQEESLDLGDEIAVETGREGGHRAGGPRAPNPVAVPGEALQPRVPDYDLLRCIGGGAYGEWLARSLATGVFRAAKIVQRHTPPT